uniref:Ribosomal protein L2 n=1 Tax=Navicula veneta TaxID=138539 RepID=A0A8F0WGI8_9STRA|nr:ribosomal protein L2 [Navicula veneta]QWM93647.1 ribosomal protein L2 [Navicula veneta]
MILKFLKPTTPSQRNLVRLNRKQLRKKPIIKTEISGLKNSSGRNFSGKITVRHRGNGHKKNYRKINFSRTIKSTGIVVSIEYDPNRNSNIAAIYDFTKNFFFYILAPKKLNVGNIVESGFDAEFNTGNAMPISRIPEGSFIHNVGHDIKKKTHLTRAAGTFAVLKEKTSNYARVKLSSKQEKLIPLQCYATLGVLSNESYFLTRLGKAGHSRWLNKRPKVRGVAMNPVDHPHGGGEGKKSGKGFSPWGRPNKKSSKKK